MRAAMPSVQAEAETEQRGGFDIAVEPAAGGELVLDQAVGGRRIGHAQQRLGQHHQREPLLGRQRIGVEKILDAAEAAGLGADRLDQAPRPRVNTALRGGRSRAALARRPAANPRPAARRRRGRRGRSMRGHSSSHSLRPCCRRRRSATSTTPPRAKLDRLPGNPLSKHWRLRGRNSRT